MTDSIFTQIINRPIPATIRYEDETFIAFDDIYPAAPIHVLLVPKKPYEKLQDVPEEDAVFHAQYLKTARHVANLVGVGENFQLKMNCGDAVQAVPHIHMHIMGGWKDTSTVK